MIFVELFTDKTTSINQGRNSLNYRVSYCQSEIVIERSKKLSSQLEMKITDSTSP
jgi:hypothetical protein